MLGNAAPFKLKLVQGSHIIVPALYEGTQGFVLQNDDGRIVFVYPYLDRYTLIGTTEVVVSAPCYNCGPLAHEIDYLHRTVRRYLERWRTAFEIVWSYAGIRPPC